MLNILTPKTVAAVASGIQYGIRGSLDWPLDKTFVPSFDGQRFEQSVYVKTPGVTKNDDVAHFNT